jgi:hypothetical protein
VSAVIQRHMVGKRECIGAQAAQPAISDSSRFDVLEVTTVLSSTSTLFIWVGYKTGSVPNELIRLCPNCSAPHRHMVGSCDVCIALVHASYPAAIYWPELARLYPS